MDITVSVDENSIENKLQFLEKENNRLNNEVLVWREYTQKILRLIKTFKNEYIITQTKCIDNIKKFDEKNGGGENDGDGDYGDDGDDRGAIGFNNFLRGKLHTITEVINDFNIINSIKIVDDTNCETSLEETLNIERK